MDGLASIVSPQVWARIIAAGTPKTFEPGATLLFEGGRADRVLGLLSGRVKVSRVEPDGRSLVLAVRGPGELLGEMGLLGQAERSATVTAIDECRTQVIHAERFLALVQELGLAQELLRHAFQRLRQTERFYAQLAGAPAGARVARGLLWLAVPASTSDGSRADGHLDIGLDQREFGQAVRLSRASVAAELGRLRAEGIVVTRRGRIVIQDTARLRELAAE
ncbi:Crp/Fnr family transcriptional regulator [Actinomadura sp. DC4]|uniref:Crp/Fnr family transcriptional regulator n=1 Tax=Actinomadura sp. DC4 TaxID=3055069 RepID=UPI0025B1C845|nr:Crp/Fnr family transcriptional regulator [Actinomadura sp. DC4]MDN3356776.1 Crp/Fnr family transcriptional regulator [Actinomadura sp. DC4]